MKRFSKPILALFLCCTIGLYGCSTAWVTTLDNILVATAPALINILNIISIAKGQPLNTTLAAKITSDAATVKTLASNFAAASEAAAPTACAQLQAAISTYTADQAQVMSLAPGLSESTLTEVTTLSALVSGTVVAILDVIPNCAQAATFRATLSHSAVPIPLRSFVNNYNTRLVVPTGNSAVDTYTKSHKIHVHSKFVRVISFGQSY